MKKTALVSVIFLLCHILTGKSQSANTSFPPVSLYTNIAYDAALIPNIGVQVALPKGWTIGLSWDGSWWGGEGHSWKVYGPELTARWYFANGNANNTVNVNANVNKNAPAPQPYTGHHIGFFTHALTYDIQRWGGTGYLGGEPGGHLFDGANWIVGAEYGYTFRLTSQLDLDLSVGLGYFGGKYYTYQYEGGQYIWLTTARRNYWGVTRVGVTLYWNIPL